MPHYRTAFELLSQVISSNPGMTFSNLAEKLVSGAYDPELADSDLVLFLARCEEVLDQGLADRESDARILTIWLDTTSRTTIQAVGRWANAHYPGSVVR